MKFSCTVIKEVPVEFPPYDTADDYTMVSLDVMFAIDGYETSGDRETPPDSGWDVTDVTYWENGKAVPRWEWFTDAMEDVIIEKIDWNDFKYEEPEYYPNEEL